MTDTLSPFPDAPTPRTLDDALRLLAETRRLLSEALGQDLQAYVPRDLVCALDQLAADREALARVLRERADERVDLDVAVAPHRPTTTASVWLTSHHVQARYPSGRVAVTPRSGLVGAPSLARVTAWLWIDDLSRGDEAVGVDARLLTPAQRDWLAYADLVEATAVDADCRWRRDVGDRLDRPCAVRGAT